MKNMGLIFLMKKFIMPFVLKVAELLWLSGERMLIDGIGVNGTAKGVDK